MAAKSKLQRWIQNQTLDLHTALANEDVDAIQKMSKLNPSARRAFYSNLRYELKGIIEADLDPEFKRKTIKAMIQGWPLKLTIMTIAFFRNQRS